MHILGLNDSNSAAAIIRDGKLIAAAREERFDRIKNSDAFPAKAVSYCLKAAGISISEVDHVVFAWNPGHELEPLDDTAAVREHKQFLHYVPNNLLAFVGGHKSNKRIGAISQRLEMPGWDMDIHYLPHHQCHAAGAFFVSPYDEALVLTGDAYGDDITTQLFHGRGNKLTPLAETKFPHSIGSVYAAVTQYLGFRANIDEWKVMGLSPYGDKTYYDEFARILRFDEKTGRIKVDLDYFTYYIWSPRRYSDLFEERFGPERYYGDAIEQRHKDIAASFQAVVEDVYIAAIRYGVEKTGTRNLCLSGGCAMNSKMNGRILAEGVVDNLYVQSSADDGGACLGACFYYWNGVLGHPREFEYTHDFWGPGFTDEEIREALEDAKQPYEQVDNIEATAAAFIAQGNIVGWFQGRQEYGQRALGNRSILADPRSPEMKDRINACVKHREEFRPFAPSIQEERTGEYFEVDYPVPFMQKVFLIREDKRKDIPAVTHVDGSGRLQTVSRKTNPRYWRLIDEFSKLSGVPIVLNTSFNDNDEPIVTSPKDALRCFSGTGMDILCIGQYVVKKGA
ncbi:carbamoyltransferase [Pseudodesulfovibrio sp.]|uniref:carbamoyltransferase family protein n=1 Tax=unclassified Pseudodesulfovibrio TaxID=2661612 RepID=UPI003B000ECE